MTYVIHGATGAQGAPVAAALAAAGKSAIALTRNADAAVPGARVVPTDCSSAEQLTAVYRGAAGVFVHLPMALEEDRQTYARNVVTAVETARPSRVVFSTSGMHGPDATAVSAVIDGLAATGVSHAVVAPELFFENLLLPSVLEPAREQGVLRYPVAGGFAISWASHLDVAEVAVALFDQPDVEGVIAVGQHPAITGKDLAEAFGARFAREVVYQAISPEEFRTTIAPLFGDGPAAAVAQGYAAMRGLPNRSISPERSAQELLGVTPRTAARWLADIGLR